MIILLSVITVLGLIVSLCALIAATSNLGSIQWTFSDGNFNEAAAKFQRV